MRRSLTALLTVAVVLLAANLVVQLAGPAQAQVGRAGPPRVVTISAAEPGGNPAVFRLWSDDTIQCSTSYWNNDQLVFRPWVTVLK